ncbi:ABC transporter ATP-binding protein [Ectothiorhodospiraceae bacterium BW-2]|nr:ABC transporter ATP-binding protein [Ectothiorhodospiraceae bacterium BW-2]
MTIPALEIRQLYKRYSNGFEALKGIDLEVEPGDFFALLGPNGAGKSTTIGIIMSLVNRSGGQIKIFGHDTQTETMLTKRLLGLVPQEFNFNQFEPIEEIVLNQAGFYGVKVAEARRRCQWALESLGLWEKRRNMARTLSGGMKRRLMIARAMIHQPKLLILDEPTAGVDIELRRSMWSFLQQVNQMGTTIILTTHYLEEAEQLCKNVAIIDQGEIVTHTSIKSLIATLDRETFIFDLRSDISKIPQLPCGYPVKQIDNHTLEIEINRSQSMNHLFEDFSQLGIEVMSMRNKSNRLEELFLDLVEKKSN